MLFTFLSRYKLVFNSKLAHAVSNHHYVLAFLIQIWYIDVCFFHVQIQYALLSDIFGQTWIDKQSIYNNFFPHEQF